MRAPCSWRTAMTLGVSAPPSGNMLTTSFRTGWRCTDERAGTVDGCIRAADALARHVRGGADARAAEGYRWDDHLAEPGQLQRDADGHWRQGRLSRRGSPVARGRGERLSGGRSIDRPQAGSLRGRE